MLTINVREVEKNVKRGAALLDRAKPGWRDEVKSRILKMEHCTDCVLGQLYGEYRDGLTRLNLGYDYMGGESSLHGFTLPDSPSLRTRDEDWDALKDLWIKEIGQGA